MSAEFFSVVSPHYSVVELGSPQPIEAILRMARARLDVSQVEVAARAGVSRYRLHLAERGFVALTSVELRALARILELPGLAMLAEQRSDPP